MNLKRYAELARQAAAESCVLLENEKETLPIKKGSKVAVFGRSAFNYYKSGLGSGGMVHTRYVTGILDALKASQEVELDEKLLISYEKWLEAHPYDEGEGWGKTPWSQEEMPVTEEMLEACKRTTLSIIIIGRTAGEDQDNTERKGSYLLTDTEEELIKKVCATAPKTVVLLNTGNIIDMGWVKKYRPQAVMYVWQGGQEGGNGVLDVLSGRVNPCGKLTDTIAEKLEQYPSSSNFGDPVRNIYKEDIYVGYRYFETFAPKEVLYPFGYGKSYTSFSIKGKIREISEKEVWIDSEVRNTGGLAGKEVIQIYVETPQGRLGNPLRKLVAFQKTGELEPGEIEKISFTVPKYLFASYDDCGVTGYSYAYVLEAGMYKIFAGNNVRTSEMVGEYQQNFCVLEQLEPACAPKMEFERMHPEQKQDGTLKVGWRKTIKAGKTNRASDDEKTCEIAYKGAARQRLIDVKDGKISMEEFVSQLTDEDLICMFRGEGMCSPRVTPGTAAAFGGVTEQLQNFGIPAACCSDGPSGIRMDCGTKAFSLPNGTALGCTFNEKLVEELFEMTGKELFINRIDALLGPGMNLHRNPLNGRNFEYISEDPLLTGRIAAAQVRAMKKAGVSATIKHFCGNNQEYGRRSSDSVISERALREIYLRGFEIAIKEGGADAVMTTYGSVNGLWTAGNFELCTKILRKEWGFTGIVMSDWWAEANYDGRPSDVHAKAPMVKAQNDLYMCVPNPSANPENDDVNEKLAEGYLTRAELVRNGENILRFLLNTPALLRMEGRITDEEDSALPLSEEILPEGFCFQKMDEELLSMFLQDHVSKTSQGQTELFGIELPADGEYLVGLKVKSDFGPLAQLPVSIFWDEKWCVTVNIQGSEGKEAYYKGKTGYLQRGKHCLKLFYGAAGLELLEIRLSAD